MSIEVGIQRLTAFVLILTCVSHIAAPGAWVRLFAVVRAQGEAAGLWIAAIHLPLGLMIAAFHDIWTWPGIVVTLLGFALVVKGLVHLTMPSVAARSLDLIQGERGAGRLRLGGLLMLPLGLGVGWIALGGAA